MPKTLEATHLDSPDLAMQETMMARSGSDPAVATVNRISRRTSRSDPERVGERSLFGFGN